ncbi:hypothetical protein K402DRAFT_12542 [Aulographum hederae CBS 113979]|uniref:Uncharacterized protein n=1 Tax=Aulographum hederae CBS 113979 TaxID=1176131 RepID=A0A6G1H7K0_9PEZI|nr:hypothetical protein K402DRAFT_12542 [Aulographum hederae CBS 113979]
MALRPCHSNVGRGTTRPVHIQHGSSRRGAIPTSGPLERLESLLQLQEHRASKPVGRRTHDLGGSGRIRYHARGCEGVFERRHCLYHSAVQDEKDNFQTAAKTLMEAINLSGLQLASPTMGHDATSADWAVVTSLDCNLNGVDSVWPFAPTLRKLSLELHRFTAPEYDEQNVLSRILRD